MVTSNGIPTPARGARFWGRGGAPGSGKGAVRGPADGGRRHDGPGGRPGISRRLARRLVRSSWRRVPSPQFVLSRPGATSRRALPPTLVLDYLWALTFVVPAEIRKLCVSAKNTRAICRPLLACAGQRNFFSPQKFKVHIFTFFVILSVKKKRNNFEGSATLSGASGAYNTF